MDPVAIFALIEKGLTLLPILIDAGTSIASTVSNLTTLSQAGQSGAITQAQLDAIEAQFDAQLTDFNTPIA